MMSYDEVYDLYINKNLSVREISELKQVHYNEIKNLIVRNKIKKTEIIGTSNIQIKQRKKYHDRDWCYHHFVVLGKECRTIARELGETTRVIEKWVNSKFKFNNNYRRDNFVPTSRQLEIIYAGVLGDGCISKRKDIDFTQYIFVQEESHKDYIFWIHNELKNMCKSEFPKGREEISKLGKADTHVMYRTATRGYKFLNSIYDMSKIEVMNNLGEMGISLFFLDDGGVRKESGAWSICMGLMSDLEVRTFIDILSNKFNIQHSSTYIKDNKYWYIRFNLENSNKISDMIIRNISSDLDIVVKKCHRRLNNDK